MKKALPIAAALAGLAMAFFVINTLQVGTETDPTLDSEVVRVDEQKRKSLSTEEVETDAAANDSSLAPASESMDPPQPESKKKYAIDSALLDSVSWRSEDLSYRDGQSFSVTETVEAAMAGDAYAQFESATFQLHCAAQPRNRSEVEARIEQYLQTRVVREPGAFGADITDAQFAQMQVKGMWEWFEICQEFRRTIDGEAEIDFRRVAVENGSASAMIWAAIEKQQTEPDYAYELAESAWNLGKWSALDTLSDLAQHRYEQGMDTTGNIESAALYLAYVELYQRHDAHFREVYGGSSGYVLGLHHVAERKIDALLPHQRPAAIERAEDLLRSNPTCCLE